MSYANLDMIRARLGLVDTSTNDDGILQIGLDWASGLIDKRTDRVFDSSRSSGATRYYTRDDVDPWDQRVLYLGYDCLTITHLVNGDGTVITSDQYVLEPRNAPTDHYPYYAIRLLTSHGAYWVWPVDAYAEAQGTWAYSDAPDDEIIGHCLRLAEWFYRSKAPLTTTTLFDGSVQRETPEGFPTETLVALDQRRRLSA